MTATTKQQDTLGFAITQRTTVDLVEIYRAAANRTAMPTRGMEYALGRIEKELQTRLDVATDLFGLERAMFETAAARGH